MLLLQRHEGRGEIGGKKTEVHSGKNGIKKETSQGKRRAMHKAAGRGSGISKPKNVTGLSSFVSEQKNPVLAQDLS